MKQSTSLAERYGLCKNVEETARQFPSLHLPSYGTEPAPGIHVLPLGDTYPLVRST
jgi:hypothetical protein